MVRRRLAAGLLVLGACGGEPPPETDAGTPAPIPEGPLLDPNAWTIVEAADDPFDDRPADVDCRVGGFGPEAGIFEVETDICPYLTAVQPLPADIPAGAKLTTVVWHLALFAEAPARGHVAVQVADTLVFETAPPIPGPEGVYPVEWIAPEPLPAGTPVYFHVHNHGYNSWRLGPFEAKSGP